MAGGGPEPVLPSPWARAAGVALAAVTAWLAVATVRAGLSDDASAIDAALRIGAGAVLLVLAAGIALLAAAPGLVRSLLERRRRG